MHADPAEPAHPDAGTGDAPGPGTFPPDLARWLADAGLCDAEDPVTTWRMLREAALWP